MSKIKPEGGHFMKYYKKGYCTEWTVNFNTSLCYSKRKRRKRLMSSRKNDLLQHYKAAETR